MAMRIITRKTLKEYVESLKGHQDQPAVETALNCWYGDVCKAAWKSSADVKLQYATASIINAARLVFNIKGNDYRLIVEVNYQKGLIWIIWLGTHKEYDRIDAAEVKYDV